MIGDLIAELVVELMTWRFYVCLAVAVAIIVVLYQYFPGWPWNFAVSCGIVVAAIAAAIGWERRT